MLVKIAADAVAVICIKGYFMVSEGVLSTGGSGVVVVTVDNIRSGWSERARMNIRTAIILCVSEAFGVSSHSLSSSKLLLLASQA